MRGEDFPVFRELRFRPGSPPHARGRQGLVLLLIGTPRITPACAGKTGYSARKNSSNGDHPRMRGEDHYLLKDVVPDTGSPPHARGRRNYALPACGKPWITPACAGKTVDKWVYRRVFPDHPRMRGEDFARSTIASSRSGSPPHARGRRHPRIPRGHRTGITPACAGKTIPG